MAEEDDRNVSDAEAAKAEVEAKARESGWKPEDEYEGPEGKWVDAGEFLRRGELFDTIHKSNRAVKKLEKMVTKLVEHNSAIEKAAYDKAIKDLTAQKKAAAAENDVARVVEIDERLEAVREKKAAAPTLSQDKDEGAEVFAEWREEQEWFGKDQDMTAYANGIGSVIENEHGPESDDPWPHKKILAEVAKRTAKAFEWKTKNLNRETPNKVGASKGGTATVKSSKLPTYNDLPTEAQETYREWVKTDKNPHGIMTKEEFLRQYALRAGTLKEDE